MKTSLLMAIICLSLTTQAQDPVLFNEKVHDFGELEESAKPSTYTFTFVNQSNDTLKINNVKASCGCTTPSWTREYIAPGDTGLLTAAYRTYNRPGSFNKSLRVSISSGQQQTLYIKGTVNPREKNPKETYPVALGNVRTKFQAVNMGNFTTEKPIAKAFTLFNDSEDTIIMFSEKHVLPAYISLSTSKNYILPKGKLRISVTADPEKMSKLGFSQGSIRLATNDEKVPIKSYLVFTTVEEFFPPMTDEEKLLAPQLSFDNNTIDFGDLTGNTEIEKTILLTNTGKSKLNIRQIDSNCDCILTSMKKQTIGPGKETKLKVKFLTEGRVGRQYKTITVFSNDPERPTQTLSVKAQVK